MLKHQNELIEFVFVFDDFERIIGCYTEHLKRFKIKIMNFIVII